MARLRVAIANTTTQIGHHGCTLVNRQIAELAAGAGMEIVRWLPARVPVGELDRGRIDAVVVNGEGSVHHDKHEALNIADLAENARRLGMPAYLVNSVYEENSAALGARLAAFRKVWVRDGASAAEAARHGIAATVVPDLTLTWRADVVGRGRDLVVNDSTRRAVREDLFRLARAEGAPYLSMKTRPPLLAAYPDRNLVRRIVFSAKRTASLAAPDGQWRAAYRNVIFSFEDFVAFLVERAGLLVTGRFHGLCLALDLEIPFLAVASNTRKVQSLLGDAGIEGRLVGDVEAVRQRIRADGIGAFALTPDEIDRIRAFRRSARTRAEAMFAEIVEDARGGGAG